jgi:preprotein translocase subunit YajC
MNKQIIFLFTVFFSFSAFAESTAEQPSTLTSLMPLVLVALILYFIIFRPQMKKEKNREKMVNELKAGDSVVTDSGIYGVISKVNDKEGLILLEISKGNIIKIKNRNIIELGEKNKSTKSKNSPKIVNKSIKGKK